jgi:hypothetical protein
LNMPTFDEAPELKPKWRERFDFYDAYGAPSSPQFRTAYKALTGRQRRLINFNFFGFFFGPLYFIVLGMWKRGLTLLGIALAVSLLEGVFVIATGIDIPRPVDFGIDMGFAALSALTVNYSYYLNRVKGNNGWNPFEGLRKA